jgi:membrane protein EpsK
MTVFPSRAMTVERVNGPHIVAPVGETSLLKRQFLPNLLSNGTVLGLNILISLWFTPYLIRRLGVAVYGLLPLAFTMSNYLNVITLSLNNAAGRFLAIDLKKKDNLSANRTFNTNFFGNLGVIVLCLPIVAAMLFLAPRLFNIPAGQETAATYLFLTVFAAYLLGFFRSSFSVSSWALNRFDLRNIFGALFFITRAGFVVLLFSAFRPSLFFLGSGIFLATCVWLAGDFLLWKKLTPQLRIQAALFDRTRLGQFFSMGGWLLINQLGLVLFLKMDLVIANMFLGAKAAGEYGSVLVFSSLIQQVAFNMSVTLTPSFVSKFAGGDHESLERISQLALKFMGLVLVLPVGLICGLARPILLTWLGKDFLHLQPLLVMLTFHLALNLAVRPLFGLNIAFNKVRLPGLFTLAAGIGNLVLAVVLVRAGWGVVGIALSSAISLTAKNLLFTPLYAAHIQKLPLGTYYARLLPLAALNGVFAGIVFWIDRLAGIRTLPMLAVVAACISMAYLLLTYRFFLKKDEKALLWKLLPSRLRPEFHEDD